MQNENSLAQYSAIFYHYEIHEGNTKFSRKRRAELLIYFTHSLKTIQYGRQSIMARREF